MINKNNKRIFEGDVTNIQKKRRAVIFDAKQDLFRDIHREENSYLGELEVDTVNNYIPNLDFILHYYVIAERYKHGVSMLQVKDKYEKMNTLQQKIKMDKIDTNNLMKIDILRNNYHEIHKEKMCLKQELDACRKKVELYEEEEQARYEEAVKLYQEQEQPRYEEAVNLHEEQEQAQCEEEKTYLDL